MELGEKPLTRGLGDIGEGILATPAFVDSRIYIRGHKNLFCIEQSQ